MALFAPNFGMFLRNTFICSSYELFWN